MADSKISALTAATVAAGANEIPINEAGTTKKVTVTQIQTLLAIPVKATGAEVTIGTDDAKFATAKALADAGVNTRLKSKRITASRDAAGAAGDVAYTGLGFTPTSIQAIAAISSGTANSVGHSDSAKDGYCISSASGTTWIPYAALILVYPQANGNFQLAVVKSYDADGFTLTWEATGPPTGTITLSFLCFR